MFKIVICYTQAISLLKYLLNENSARKSSKKRRENGMKIVAVETFSSQDNNVYDKFQILLILHYKDIKGKMFPTK